MLILIRKKGRGGNSFCLTIIQISLTEYLIKMRKNHNLVKKYGEFNPIYV